MSWISNFRKKYILSRKVLWIFGQEVPDLPETRKRSELRHKTYTARNTAHLRLRISEFHAKRMWFGVIRAKISMSSVHVRLTLSDSATKHRIKPYFTKLPQKRIKSSITTYLCRIASIIMHWELLLASFTWWIWGAQVGQVPDTCSKVCLVSKFKGDISYTKYTLS